LNRKFVHCFFFYFEDYYTCKEDVIARVRCSDKQLFDEDNRVCADYRKVFCENRPVNERGIDPCKKLDIFLFFFVRVNNLE